MSKRFLSPPEKALFREMRFTSWLVGAYPAEKIFFSTLTIPSENRSALISDVSKRWNSLNSNYLSKNNLIYGWARYLELHENGIPHYHILFVTNDILTSEQLSILRKEFRAASLNHGFGVRFQLERMRGMPAEVIHYLSKQARLAKEHGCRPDNMREKRLFAASSSFRADFKRANPKGVTWYQKPKRIALWEVIRAAKALRMASPSTWCFPAVACSLEEANLSGLSRSQFG